MVMGVGSTMHNITLCTTIDIGEKHESPLVVDSVLNHLTCEENRQDSPTSVAIRFAMLRNSCFCCSQASTAFRETVDFVQVNQ